jgi:hypothetical protein
MKSIAFVALIALLSACDRAGAVEGKSVAGAAEGKSVAGNGYPLEFEERCADQARKRVADLGWIDESGRSLLLSWDSHYNATFGRCFVRVSGNVSGIMSISVHDAHRGVEYAGYTVYLKGKGQGECSVVLPNAERRFCQSRAEFDALVKVYMGDLKLTPR